VNLDDIRAILELVREHQLAELELERDGIKIRVRKDTGIQTVTFAPSVLPATPAPGAVPPAASAPAASLPRASAETAVAPADEGEGVELAIVKSPIVGTFYSAPEPGAPSFVELGDAVRKSQVLCIIEAMKLMNEIESEYEGEVVKVYVENGQPVQYGERLFAIRTTS
jgi:acetyl-CoA carboxylase biotin carboxyl carrier protein